MKKTILIALTACTVLGVWPAFAQVKQTKEQILFYTSQWTGERFPDGRPKVPDDLLKRAVNCTIEDIQGYLSGQGYRNAYEGGWVALHPGQPFAGRALTAQFMPQRADMQQAVAAEGKTEKRAAVGTNSWVINELTMGDTMVVDGYGKIFEGTIIGSNLGAGIAANTHNGFVFDGGIRDQAENREHPGLTGLYRGYDPAGWAQMQLTGINVPVRIGHATVLPGDLVLATVDGVIFIPPHLAAEAIGRAEFTLLTDAYNFELNAQGLNKGQLEGGWDAAKYAGFVKWIDAHPEKLKMPRAEFDTRVKQATERQQGGGAAPGAGGRGAAPGAPAAAPGR